MPPDMLMFATVLGGFLLIGGIAVVFVWRGRVLVPPGSALVIHRTGGESRVTFSDAFVPPLVARAEAIDCSIRTIPIVRVGKDSLRCRDNLRVDVCAEFQISINRTAEDVLKVAQSVGAARGSDPATLRELFEAKLIDALATVIRQLTLDELSLDRERLRDQVIMVVGQDLGGYVLHDLAFSRLEQVSLEALDPDNIQDAEAIRRITERLAEEHRRTNELRMEMARDTAAAALATREAELRR